MTAVAMGYREVGGGGRGVWGLGTVRPDLCSISH